MSFFHCESEWLHASLLNVSMMVFDQERTFKDRIEVENGSLVHEKTVNHPLYDRTIEEACRFTKAMPHFLEPSKWVETHGESFGDRCTIWFHHLEWEGFRCTASFQNKNLVTFLIRFQHLMVPIPSFHPLFDVAQTHFLKKSRYRLFILTH